APANTGEHTESRWARPRLHALSVPPEQPAVGFEEYALGRADDGPEVGERAMLLWDLRQERDVSEIAVAVRLQRAKFPFAANPEFARAVNRQRADDRRGHRDSPPVGPVVLDYGIKDAKV